MNGRQNRYHEVRLRRTPQKVASPFATATSICRRRFTTCSGVCTFPPSVTSFFYNQFQSSQLVQKRPGTPLLGPVICNPVGMSVFGGQSTLRRGKSTIAVADLLAGLSAEENTRAGRVGALKANGFYLRWLACRPCPRGPNRRSNSSTTATSNSMPMPSALLLLPSWKPTAMLRVKIVTRSNRTEHPPAISIAIASAKYAAIGTPILSLICFVYILISGIRNEPGPHGQVIMAE